MIDKSSRFGKLVNTVKKAFYISCGSIAEESVQTEIENIIKNGPTAKPVEDDSDSDSMSNPMGDIANTLFENHVDEPHDDFGNNDMI